MAQRRNGTPCQDIIAIAALENLGLSEIAITYIHANKITTEKRQQGLRMQMQPSRDSEITRRTEELATRIRSQTKIPCLCKI